MELSYVIDRLDQVTAHIGGMTDRMRRELRTELEHQVGFLVAAVRQKLTGQVLQIVSGKLLNNVSGDVADDQDAMIGRAFVNLSAVPYARIQELGGTTGAHPIVARNADFLRFEWNGEMVFRRKVYHPGSKIQGTAYLSGALADSADSIVEALAEAALRGAQA